MIPPELFSVSTELEHRFALIFGSYLDLLHVNVKDLTLFVRELGQG